MYGGPLDWQWRHEASKHCQVREVVRRVPRIEVREIPIERVIQAWKCWEWMIHDSKVFNPQFLFCKRLKNLWYNIEIYRMSHFQYFCFWLEVCCRVVVIPISVAIFGATLQLWAVCQVPKKVVQEVEQPVYRPVPHMAGSLGDPWSRSFTEGGLTLDRSLEFHQFRFARSNNMWRERSQCRSHICRHWRLSSRSGVLAVGSFDIYGISGTWVSTNFIWNRNMFVFESFKYISCVVKPIFSLTLSTLPLGQVSVPTNEDGVVIPQSQVTPASPAVQATSPAASPGVLSAPVTRTYELPPVTSGTGTAPCGAPDMPACFRGTVKWLVMTGG